MKKQIAASLVFAATLLGPAPTRAAVQWERSWGGTDMDFANDVKSTSDGGYILGGYSYSDASGNKTSANFVAGDYWLVKLDASGNKQWDKSCGGTNFDGIKSLQQTSDGGYILGGISFSDISGNKTSASLGAGDYWVVKLDGSGNKQWDQSYGGTELDDLACLQQTSDGGYVLGGISFSGVSGNKTSARFGAADSSDYWLVKLDANGNKQWEKTFGGSEGDVLRSVQPTADGGYIVGGSSSSGVSGNKTSANLGDGTSDYWMIKLDAGGNKQWEKCYGGDDAEELYSVQQTSDGGYVLGGHSYSGASGNKTSGSHGSHDYWVLKLDADGNKQWETSCGGDDADKLYSVQQTSDGGYMLGGISMSGVSGNKTSAGFGPDSAGYWIVKLDVSGNKQWEESVPASYWGEILRLQQSPDGGSIVAGLAGSVSGELDFAVTKLKSLLHASFSFGSDRTFRTQFTGLAGTSYVLQASTNLIHWQSLLTNSAPNGVINFTDADTAGFSQRFYRVQQH